ncbi:hypothetical protein [Bradyrhizobium sp.]
MVPGYAALHPGYKNANPMVGTYSRYNGLNQIPADTLAILTH